MQQKDIKRFLHDGCGDSENSIWIPFLLAKEGVFRSSTLLVKKIQEVRVIMK